MFDITDPKRSAQDIDFIVRTAWHQGSRSPLWDALWHRILADIAPHGRLGQPSDVMASNDPDGQF
jgi:hypothetical protein